MDAFVGEGLHPSLCFVTNKWSKDEDEREEQEEREKEWVSELSDRFHGARITRLHYEHTRASEIKLAKMSERERKEERARYRESTRELVKLALEKPARERTLLEKEIKENTLVKQTSVFHAATVTREREIRVMQKEGKTEVAEVMREETQNIGNTRLEDAGDIALSRRLAREAGEKAMGKTGGMIGKLLNWAGETGLGVYSVFATEKQAKTLEKAYHGRMVPRAAEMAKLGANIAGAPGAMVATAAASVFNMADSVFTHLFK